MNKIKGIVIVKKGRYYFITDTEVDKDELKYFRFKKVKDDVIDQLFSILKAINYEN